MESHTLYIKPETNRFLIYNQRKEQSHRDWDLNTDHNLSNLNSETSNQNGKQCEHFLNDSKVRNKSDYYGLGIYGRDKSIENLENNICGINKDKKIKNMRLRSSAYYNKISSLEHHYAHHFERLNYDLYLISGHHLASKNCPNGSTLRDTGESEKKYASFESITLDDESISNVNLTDNPVNDEGEIVGTDNVGEEHTETNENDPYPTPAEQISIESQVSDLSESRSISIQTETPSEKEDVALESGVKQTTEISMMKEFTILNDDVDAIPSFELKSLENNDKTTITSISEDNTIVATATENGNVHLFLVVSNDKNPKNSGFEGQDSENTGEYFKKIKPNGDTLTPSGKGRNINVYKKIVVKDADLMPTFSFKFFSALKNECESNEDDPVRAIAVVRKSIGVQRFYLVAVASTRLLALFIVRKGAKITLVGELEGHSGGDFLDVYLARSGRSGYVSVVCQTGVFSYKIRYGFADDGKTGEITVVSAVLTQTFESSKSLYFSRSTSEFVAAVNRDNELIVLSNPKLELLVKRKIEFQNDKQVATHTESESLVVNSMRIFDKFVLLTAMGRVYLFLLHANRRGSKDLEPKIDPGKYSLVNVAVSPGFEFVSFADFVNGSNVLVLSDHGLYIVNILTGDVFNFHFDLLSKLLQVSPRSESSTDAGTRIAVLHNKQLYDALVESSGCLFCNKYEKLVNKHDLNALLFFSASGPSLKYLVI